MNINTNIYKQYVNSGRNYGRATDKVFTINGKKSVSKQDSLSFSAEAALIKDNTKTVRSYASEITASEPEARIESLRNSIRNGEYNVSAQQVADAILDRWI